MRAAGVQVDEALSKRIYEAMFQGFLKRQVAGSPLVLNDLKTIREFLASPALMAIFEAPVALVALLLNFAISPILGWASVVSATVLVIVTWLNERATSNPFRDAIKSSVAAQQFAEASLRNAHVIEAMGMLDAIHAR